MKLGFIGVGNMGSAILKGILKSGVVSPKDICIFDPNIEKVEQFSAVEIASSPLALNHACDIVFLCIKPQGYGDLLGELSPHTSGKTYVSIAAGIHRGFFETYFPAETNLILVMPNTPLMVGEGATVIGENSTISTEIFQFIVTLFNTVGKVGILPENQMNAMIAVQGSSPAFIYLFAQTVLEYAKSYGIEEELAKEMFCQTLMGSSKMMMETEFTPKELIDMVTSKGGTTIAAITEMKDCGLERALRQGYEACKNRADELAKS